MSKHIDVEVGEELPRDQAELQRLRELAYQWIAATRVTLGRMQECLKWVERGDVASPMPLETDPLLETDAARFIAVHDRNDLLVRYLPDDDRQSFLESTQAAAEMARAVGDRLDSLMRPGVLDADVDAIIAGNAKCSESDRETLRESLAWRRANLELGDGHRRMRDGLTAAMGVVKRLEDRIVKQLGAAKPIDPDATGGGDQRDGKWAKLLQIYDEERRADPDAEEGVVRQKAVDRYNREVKGKNRPKGKGKYEEATRAILTRELGR
ncbi:MAG: hypothetical protein HYV60_08255 [Planctomycetia bacterium]|nr:hypothetical protein [Planctomycetia bacterium]